MLLFLSLVQIVGDVYDAIFMASHELSPLSCDLEASAPKHDRKTH